ncbi:endonuclease [Streptomyces sp. NPDC049881]|uniref:endonuclease I family protein n=1 Tax=unclassified Streptomyces TaxID=2593676 RepID=UPI00342AD3B3
MRIPLAAGALALALLVPAPYASADGAADAAGYYDDAEGLTGAALRDALHDIVSTGVTTLTYAQVWDALKVTDRAPSDPDSVVLFYTGQLRDADENGGAVGDWNREHLWAQSHGDFGTGRGPGTDLHHLRPTDVQVNSTRGNKDFDDGGSAAPGAPGNYTDADSWEPRDADKGDVARALFYMAVRWEGGGGFADLELNDAVDNGGSPYMGRLSTLLEWHEADPPDAFERQRNETVYASYQHNRNPFVDHPEWAAEIWD